MRTLTALFALSLVTGAASAQTWTVDKSHSRVGFTVTHMLVSEVDGNFKNFDAKLTSGKDDLSDAVFEMTADVNSIDTDNDRRDNHLKSADFFDAAKYPTVSFKSNSFKKVGPKNYKLAGDLTMHGVTKPVTLDVVMNGPLAHPRSKNPFIGMKATSQIKRSDFGIGTIPVGVASDEIELRVNGEFERK